MSRRPRGRNRQQNNSNQNNNPNRALDSNGPDVRVRGSAKTIFDKYTSLAHDASVSGHRVKAESYLQHAEHYLRINQEIEKKNAAKAEQQRLLNEQREQEQAAKRAKHAARVEARKIENENNQNQGGEKKDQSQDVSNSDEAVKNASPDLKGEVKRTPSRRSRNNVSRRKPAPDPSNKTSNGDEQSTKAEEAAQDSEKPVKAAKPTRRKKAVAKPAPVDTETKGAETISTQKPTAVTAASSQEPKTKVEEVASPE